MVKKSKSQKNTTVTYDVILPKGVKVLGYESIGNLSGISQAVSPRDAVYNLIARREEELIERGYRISERFTYEVMGALDSEFGGAENRAFEHPQIRPPFVEQTYRNSRGVRRMSLKEKLVIREHAYAHDLAEHDHEDTSDPRVRMKYLARARYLLDQMRKRDKLKK